MNLAKLRLNGASDTNRMKVELVDQNIVTVRGSQVRWCLYFLLLHGQDDNAFHGKYVIMSL